MISVIDMYQLKMLSKQTCIKVLHKSPLEETLFQGNCTKCKTDVIVADHTNSAKLVLWEDIIDKVDSGKSYRFNNCKICIFDDHKYINTN